MNSDYHSDGTEVAASTKNPTNRWQNFFLIAPLLIISTGCSSNLSSVEEFGAGSTELITASNAFAADIYASCIRRLDFITRVPVTSNEADKATNQTEKIRNETRQQCIQENQKVANQTKLVNQIPVDYMLALGELAAKNPVDFSANINAIKQALNNLSIPTTRVDRETEQPLPPFTFNTTVVEAGSNILEFITNQLTGQFQKQKIKEAILCNNKPFHIYLTGEKPINNNDVGSSAVQQNGLVQLVDEVFVQGYSEIEREEISTFYRTEIAQIVAIQNRAVEQKNDLVNLKAIELLEYFRQAANADDNLTQSRINSAIAYMDLLKRTAAAHNELYQSFLTEEERTITPEKIQQRCPSPEDSTEKLARKASDDVFQMSDAEFAKFQQSLTDFLIEVEPLFAQIDERFLTQ